MLGSIASRLARAQHRAILLTVLFGSGFPVSEALAQERWQLTLRSSQILYELEPVELSGDTLVIRQAGATRGVPLSEVTELRRVQASVDLAERARRASVSALVGADDRVFQMTLLDLAEKRALILEILAAYGPQGTARR